MTLSASARSLAYGVFALAVIVAVYWSGLSGGYVLDDFPNLVENEQTRLDNLSPRELLQGALSSDAGPLKRPLPMLSLSLERYFAGLNPFVMKLTNLAIHLSNTLLVFLLLRALIQRNEQQHGRQFLVSASTFALLTAMAWALSPINLTSVLYVIQRMESLATMFMLAGLLSYLHGRQRLSDGQANALRWMWGGIITGSGLGLMAKESAVMLPVYALLIEWLFFGFGRRQSAERGAVLRLFVVLLVLPGAIGIAWLLPRVLSNPEFANRPFDLFERLWTQARVLWHYLAWIVAPDTGSLSLYHDHFTVSRGPLTPWTTLPAALGLGALIVFAFVIRRRCLWISFGVLWFFVMHVLVSTVLNLELVYEHRNYLGSLGILLALLALLLDIRLKGVEAVRRFSVVALIALLGFTTFLRANEWSDPLKLAYFEATKNPESPRAQYALGKMLASVSDGPGSPQFSLAMGTFKEAADLPETTLLPWQALVLEHARYGLPIDESWWDGMQEYVATRPLSSEDTNALYNLVNLQAERRVSLPVGPLNEIIDTAIANKPNSALLLTIKANFLLNVVGDLDSAKALLQRAVALKPRDPAKWRNLVEYQLATGRLARAEASLSRLSALNRFGFQDEAIAEFNETLAAKRHAITGSGQW